MPGHWICCKAFIAISFTLISLCPVSAQQQDCMASYYRNKSPACLDETIEKVDRLSPKSSSDTIIGFLAQVFKESPDEHERLLKGATSGVVKLVILRSLYTAGLTEKAKRLAAALDLLATMEKNGFRPDPALDEVRPSHLPRENDLLIGAYMASGNPAFIQRILANYSSAEDRMVSDGLRIGFMNSKFGPNLVPKGREVVTLQVACAKYQCKADQTKLLRVMTLSSAIWALQSLATNDDGIGKTLANFFESDARLKNLYAAERLAFGNYLVAIVTVTALKDAQRSTEQEQAFAAMNNAASIYEKLGSPNDAAAPMAPYKNK